MKLMQRLAFSAAMALAAYGTSAAEKKVQLKDLPPAVQKTVQEETKKAKLVGLAQEEEDGKTVYEAETKIDGRTRDLIIDAAGKVIEVEEEVAIGSIPAGARAAIEKATAGNKIERVESVTKGGTTDYEASFTRNGKKSEVVVTSDGTIKKQ